MRMGFGGAAGCDEVLAELVDLPSQFMGLVSDGRCSRAVALKCAGLDDVAGFVGGVTGLAYAGLPTDTGNIGSCGMGLEMVGGERELKLRRVDMVVGCEVCAGTAGCGEGKSRFQSDGQRKRRGTKAR